jgi:hypothetical protein
MFVFACPIIAYLYASFFFVLGHIIFETTVQIPEVEFGGKYRYLS